jgi:hypothetical protein
MKTHASINNLLTIIVITFAVFVSVESLHGISPGVNNSTTINQFPDFEKKYSYSSESRQNRFDVLVNSLIYDSLSSSLLQYVSDLETQGYNVTMYCCSCANISADSLRRFLKSEYLQDTIKGAFLIGDFPSKLFQSPYSGYTLTYTTDTYFKDLDGTWLDTLREYGGILIPGSDSILDTHIAGTGNKLCEIFLGRLPASNLSNGNNIYGNEIQRLRSYFERNHAYRAGNLTRKDTALLYIDDDWVIFDSTNSMAVYRRVYPSIVAINDKNATTAQDYKQNRLPYGYEMIWVGVHSYPQGHMFKENNGTQFGNVRSYEIPIINPQALFYLVVGCDAGEYTDTNCIVLHYILSSDKGLAAISYTTLSSSPGQYSYPSVQNSAFFSALDSGKTFGEAMKSHVDFYVMRNYSYNSEAYATVYLGDPTLKLRLPQGIEEISSQIKQTNKFNIYPSISRNILHIKRGYNNLQDVGLKIYNSYGQLQRQYNLTSSKNELIVDINDLAPGIYFIKTSPIRADGKAEVLKVIKI